MFQRRCARFVETRKLADGTTAFYFCIPKYYRKLGCEIANEPLGTNYEAACGEDGRGGRAAAPNGGRNSFPNAPERPRENKAVSAKDSAS